MKAQTETVDMERALRVIRKLTRQLQTFTDLDQFDDLDDEAVAEGNQFLSDAGETIE